MDPSFRTASLDTARALHKRVSDNEGDVAMAGAMYRLVEHVEDVVHGRKTFAGPRLGAEVSLLFDRTARDAGLTLLTAMEAAMQGSTDDAKTFVAHATTLLATPTEAS